MSKATDPVLDIPANFREEDEFAQLEDSTDVEKLRSVLEEGEIVYRLLLCYHEDSDGVLAATNKRLIFADKRFIGSKVESFDYQEVAAIVYNPQIVTHTLTVVSSSRAITVEKVDLEHGDRFLDFVKNALGGEYTIKGNVHIFQHNDDMLQIEDVPSLNGDLDDSVNPEAS